MAIGSINGSSYTGYIPASIKAEVENKLHPQTEAAAKTTQKDDEVRFDKSEAAGKAESSSYDKLKEIAKTQISSFKDAQHEALRNMVNELLSGQANWFEKKETSLSFSFSFMEGMQSKEFDMEALSEALSGYSEEAQAALNDYWSIDAVSTRIMDMAVSLAGGDNSKLSVLRDAVQKGFDQAGAAWGGDLPEISGNTYDETMKRFDYWAEKGSMEGYVYQAQAKDEEEQAAKGV